MKGYGGGRGLLVVEGGYRQTRQRRLDAVSILNCSTEGFGIWKSRRRESLKVLFEGTVLGSLTRGGEVLLDVCFPVFSLHGYG